jgi:hypothetical protein
VITNTTTFKYWKDFIYVENRLNEGLILTHDPESSINVLNNYTIKILKCKDFGINYNEEKRRIEAYIINDFDTNQILQFLTLINNLGYNCKNVKLVKYNISLKRQMINSNDTNFLDFKNDIMYNNEILKQYSGMKFFLYAKFDNKVDKIDILYHITERKNNERIMKTGLINKSNSVLGFHEERIYLSKTLKGINIYYDIKIGKNRLYPANNRPIYKEEEFIVYKIDVSNSNLTFFNYNTNLTFYEDPEALSYAVYTYDNIGPNLLTEVTNWRNDT